MRKLYLVIIVSLFCNYITYGQQDSTNNKSPLKINCDLMSRYVWRGTDFGKSPSIQPKMEFSKMGFTIGAWGAFATNTTATQESDLYIGYTFMKEMLSISLTDYFVTSNLDNSKYFKYEQGKTEHVFELSASFNGTKNLPLKVLFATNIYGNDAKHVDLSDTTSNKIQYSTYTEFSYSFKYFDLFMGMNLTNPNEKHNETGFYGDNYGVVNLGITTTRDIKITNKFKLLFTISLITNPQAEKMFFVAGITL